MNNVATLTDLAAHLSSFKGYTAAERRRMQAKSKRLDENRRAWLAANGFKSEAEYQAWLFA